MQNRRYDILNETIKNLIDSEIVQVLYYDGQHEDETPYYKYPLEMVCGRHELMQGIDLLTNLGEVYSFYWHAIRDYQIAVSRGSILERLPNFDAIFDVSKEPPWIDRINQRISNAVFSENSGDDFGYICDCRIEFVNAKPIWICARQDTLDCTEHGDATIVVFDRDEAKRIGIKIDAQ